MNTMISRRAVDRTMTAALLSLSLCVAGCGDDAVGPDGSIGTDGRVPNDMGIDANRPDAIIPPLGDGGTIDALTLSFEVATPEQIGLYATVNRTLPMTSRATVRYREASMTDWRVAHPLLRINPAWVSGGAPEPPVDAFAGTIFDLIPDTLYDVEVTLEQPGMPNQVLTARTTTRALPGPAPAVTDTATPSDDLQAKFDALMPGDVLELADGTYDATGLFLASSGTEAARIYIRGASRTGVVLRAPTSRVLQLQDASHIVLENLTMEGSNTDSGTDASSVAVSFWDGALQVDVTIRGVDVRGVDQGFVASGTTRQILVYDCDVRGNNVWTPAFIETNLTWNDDGIRLPGEGNCAFENTLKGFGDSFAVIDGTFSAAIYYYRNRIEMTGDDSFEADYGTRNLAFYDNDITNAATFLSLDPLWGGPLYCFRNVVVNTIRGPFKLNDTNGGFLIYNNTIVRTEGTSGWGWVQFNNGDLEGWAFRNNILVYLGAGTQLLAVESGGNTTIDFTNNSWFPDGAVWWSTTGGSFGSLAEARAGVPATTPLFSTSTMRHENDVIGTRDPFTAPITLGADHRTQVMTSVTPTLRAGVTAKNAGVAIANINDGFAGAAPDIGAVIEGRLVPRRGAARP